MTSRGEQDPERGTDASALERTGEGSPRPNPYPEQEHFGGYDYEQYVGDGGSTHENPYTTRIVTLKQPL